MPAAAKFIFVVAALGVLAIWIYGASAYMRTLQAIRTDPKNAGMFGPAIYNWLLASRRLKGEASVYAANVNKAVYGLVICVVIAAAAAIVIATPQATVR